MFTLLAPSCEGSLEERCPFLAEEGRTEAVRPQKQNAPTEVGAQFSTGKVYQTSNALVKSQTSIEGGIFRLVVKPAESME